MVLFFLQFFNKFNFMLLKIYDSLKQILHIPLNNSKFFYITQSLLSSKNLDIFLYLIFNFYLKKKLFFLNKYHYHLNILLYFLILKINAKTSLSYPFLLF